MKFTIENLLANAILIPLLFYFCLIEIQVEHKSIRKAKDLDGRQGLSWEDYKKMTFTQCVSTYCENKQTNKQITKSLIVF